jgi:hypothetical protein
VPPQRPIGASTDHRRLGKRARINEEGQPRRQRGCDNKDKGHQQQQTEREKAHAFKFERTRIC